MRDHHYFSEYRPHDYRLPRSMREAYGHEPVLWVQQDNDHDALWWAGLTVWAIALGLVIWYAYGWL